MHIAFGDWRDGPVGKYLLCKQEGPEFRAPALLQKLGTGYLYQCLEGRHRKTLGLAGRAVQPYMCTSSSREDLIAKTKVSRPIRLSAGKMAAIKPHGTGLMPETHTAEGHCF